MRKIYLLKYLNGGLSLFTRHNYASLSGNIDPEGNATIGLNEFTPEKQQQMLKRLLDVMPDYFRGNEELLKMLKNNDWRNLNGTLRSGNFLGLDSKLVNIGQQALENNSLASVLDHLTLDGLAAYGGNLDEIVVRPYNNTLIDYLKETYPSQYSDFENFTAENPYARNDLDLIKYGNFEEFEPEKQYVGYDPNKNTIKTKKGKAFVPYKWRYNYLVDGLGDDVGQAQRMVNLASLLQNAGSPAIYENPTPREDEIALRDARVTAGAVNAQIPAEANSSENTIRLFFDKNRNNDRHMWANGYPLLDEISHLYENDDNSMFADAIGNAKLLYYDVTGNHDESYNSTGTREYRAHKMFEPALRDFYLHNSNPNPSKLYLNDWIKNYIDLHKNDRNFERWSDPYNEEIY